jgi:hypothetical protein
MSLVIKCDTKGGSKSAFKGGQKVLSRPLADSFPVGRRQKEEEEGEKEAKKIRGERSKSVAPPQLTVMVARRHNENYVTCG